MTHTSAMDVRTSRRSLLGQAAAISAIALSGCSQSAKRPLAGKASGGLIAAGDTILFQGDSITDAGRDRGREGNPNEPRPLGGGYVFMIASHLLAERADANLKIYNRGISGHKVFQLAERWDKDCISLKPNLVSILIGVNDIWHKLNGQYNGTIEIYEKDYRALLARTKKELPGVKLVVCEPFVLRCGAVNESWFPEFDQRRAVAKKLAEELKLDFVPFQSMFDEAVKLAEPSYWAGDGVHPTLAGHALMSKTWREVVGV